MNPEERSIRHKQQKSDRNRRAHQKNPTRSLQRSIRSRERRTGWTLERYAVFNYAQGGLCYNCGASPGENLQTFKLFGDHDHETNQPRGLLCVKCNAGLGMFQDNIELLEAAIKYLKIFI